LILLELEINFFVMAVTVIELTPSSMKGVGSLETATRLPAYFPKVFFAQTPDLNFCTIAQKVQAQKNRFCFGCG